MSTASSAPPAVSVLLPVRNGMPYLPQAIASILDQSWRDLECLVVDDSRPGDPPDGTIDYLVTLRDPRVRVLRTGGQGLAQALNLGLAAARAPLIARQDADDWSHPDRLAEQVAWMHAHPDVDVLATCADFIDAEGRAVENGWTQQVRSQWDVAVTSAEIAALMPLTCCIFHATVVARTEGLRAAGGYDPAMVPAEDYDLWLRMLPTVRFARLPRSLYAVRVHAASSSTIRRSEQLERVITAKLRNLRRRAPWLPTPASLWLPYEDRGAAAFRRVGPAEGFALTAPGAPAPGAPVNEADVVAITPFARVEEWNGRLTADGRFERLGNLFVRRRERTADARRAGRQAEAFAHQR